ncbi:MAG: hypothetical protein R3D00_31115 [Bacteroidia bacterium]
MRRLLFGIFLLAAHPLSAQYSYFFQQEYFFGNLPNARVEAMGRANVAVGGSVASQFFNPAGIGIIEDQEVALSTSAPFYLLSNSDYYYAGYARRIRPNLVAAISVNQMAVGPTTFKVDINNVDYPLDKPKSTNIALTAAMEPVKGLHVGINANLYRMKFFDDVSTFNALHIDAGALYRLEINPKQHLQFGASVNNAAKSSITFASPLGDEATSEFPVVARIGAAYIAETEITLPGAGTGPLELTFTAEFQDVLNNAYRTGILMGAEARVWNVFSLRLGYLSLNSDDGGLSTNKPRLSNFTYGFGFQIPLQTLTDGTVPFDVHLDYVSLEPPSYTFGGTRLSNMRTFGLRLVWPVGA